MPQPSKIISVVKTAQMADTLKLVVDGRVVGSVVMLGQDRAELRDASDRPLGTFATTAAAIAEFEKLTEVHEVDLGL